MPDSCTPDAITNSINEFIYNTDEIINNNKFWNYSNINKIFRNRTSFNALWHCLNFVKHDDFVNSSWVVNRQFEKFKLNKFTSDSF